MTSAGGKKQAIPNGAAIHFPTFAAASDAEEARTEIWIELPLEQWVVAYRLVRQGDQLTPAEQRVFPRDAPPPSLQVRLERDGTPVSGSTRLLAWTPPDAGTWSVDPKVVPPGGLTSEALRAFGTKDPQAVFAAARENMIRRLGKDTAEREFLQLTGVSINKNLLTNRPGPSDWTERELAKLARDYARLVQDAKGSSTKRLAKERGQSPSTISTRLAQARLDGLLTYPPKNGVEGGEETPRVTELLGPISGEVEDAQPEDLDVSPD